MSFVSKRYHRWRSSVIITGERVVSLVRVATTAVLSLCRSTLRPPTCPRKDYIACRTTRSSFPVACWGRPASCQKERA
jgi:hypothetical protein